MHSYIESVRRRIADASQPRSQRERLAIEAAATLDRTARSSSSPDVMRSYWHEAADFLDQYNQNHDPHERDGEFALRAANYRWAIAWSLLRESEADPANAALRERAVAATNDVTKRLRTLVDQQPNATLIPEIRYRLANALSERARVEPDLSAERRKLEAEAAELLDKGDFPIALRGHAVVLRSDLLNRQGEFQEARRRLDAAVEAKVPLPEPEATRARALALVSTGRLDEAMTLIGKAAVAPTERDVIAFEAHLAAWKTLEPGTRRTELAAELFRRAAAFHDSEARMARIALARRFDAPGPDSPPETFELLAEGRMILDQTAQATETWIAGAARAEALNQPERAAESRYRAAASLGRLGSWERAIEQLDKVLAAPGSDAVRPRAQLLRALALGESGHHARSDQALRSLVETFPRDRVADEARWLIGLSSMEAGDTQAALDSWNPIAPESPRWIDSRLAVLQSLLAVIEEPGDAAREDDPKPFEPATTYLNAAQQAATTSPQKLAIEFARLRLEMSPRRLRPEAGEATFEKMRTMPLRQGERDRLEGFRVIRLARDGHYTEAEKSLRAWVGSAQTRSLDAVAEWLDVAAELAESDLTRRRLGSLAAILLHTKMKASSGGQELDHLRLIRAVANEGDPPQARRVLRDLKLAPATGSTALLELRARTQVMLGFDEDAITTYERLAERTKRGARRWLLCRYEVAAAHLRLGRPQLARQVLETTRLLFPGLAQTDLAERYETLGKRVRNPP